MAPVLSTSSRWLRPRALIAHLSLFVWFPGCLVAGWWQVTVATAGNSLAYLYAVEWPIFAIFGVVLWWNVIHDDPETHGNRRLKALREEQRRLARDQNKPSAQPRSPVDESPPRIDSSGATSGELEDDKVLRSYNDYLEQLAIQNQPKTWRRR